MATLVSFHAHPDDESVLCGGSIALAALAGHRVVLVCATDGSHGEYPEGLLAPGECLAERRRGELREAARILGVARVVELGYRDSGMRGEPTNDAAGSFWAADRDQAAARLVEVLTEEDAEILTIYDHHGTYDHPDHIQVHRVGSLAAELASTPYVFEATLSRERLTQMRVYLDPTAANRRQVDGTEETTVGLSRDEVTTRIEIGAVLDTKRAAIAAHTSQYPGGSFFQTMPTEAFEIGFGVEWYRQRPTASSSPRTANLFLDDR
jgi:LmbE family N-acetylglucosaminyl deacetylase